MRSSTAFASVSPCAGGHERGGRPLVSGRVLAPTMGVEGAACRRPNARKEAPSKAIAALA
jgi:hypothetical protein